MELQSHIKEFFDVQHRVLKTDDDEMRQMFAEAVKCVVRTAVLCEESNMDNNVEELFVQMNVYDSVQKTLDAMNGALDHVRIKHNYESEDVLVETYMKKLNELKNGEKWTNEFKMAVHDVRQNPEYAQVTDAEVVVSRVSMDYRCPITQDEIKEVMRSTKCNHVYEKRAVLEMLRMHHNIRCPKMGCTAQISKKDLEHDVALERRIMRKRRLEDEREYENV